MTTILIDLEGTLSDHTDRLRVLQATTQMDPKDRTAWKTYYAGLIDDEPREAVMWAVHAWIQKDIRPLIYSTRFMNKHNQEEEWLRGHELWEHVDLIQRLPRETTIKGPELVSQWVGQYKPTILVDDRKEVHEILLREHPQVVVLEPDDFTIPRSAA